MRKPIPDYELALKGAHPRNLLRLFFFNPASDQPGR